MIVPNDSVSADRGMQLWDDFGSMEGGLWFQGWGGQIYGRDPHFDGGSDGG